MTGYSLHVGLNVVDTSSYIPAPITLAGCVNDANAMQRLAAGQGFRTRTLLDHQATSAAVLTGLGSMAQMTQPGDIAFISYSGHGGQVRDASGDETDRLDETWCLYDRQVLDDELNRMYSQFQSGVRIVVLSDSCHSGTVARTIMAIATREALVLNPLGQENWPQDVKVEHLRPKYLPYSAAMADSDRRQDLYRSVQALAGRTRDVDIAAELILISGCQDNQLSSDGDMNGLFTEALLNVWAQGAFRGDYRSFHSSIVRRMPPDQVPNYYTVGRITPGFQAQKPFTITAPAPGSSGGDQGNGWGDPTPQNPSGQGQGQNQGQGQGQGTSRPTLRLGSSGEHVRYLQEKLVEKGSWLSIDGRFGSATQSAVRQFQSDQGLVADGVVGPAAWAALEAGPGPDPDGGQNGGWDEPVDDWSQPDNGGGQNGGGQNGGGQNGGGDDWNQPDGGGQSGGGQQPTPQPTRPTLRRGSRGPDVVYLQQRLADFGYSLSADGSFGPATESQVRSFQRSQGLTADGVVGPATWAALG